MIYISFKIDYAKSQISINSNFVNIEIKKSFFFKTVKI